MRLLVRGWARWGMLRRFKGVDGSHLVKFFNEIYKLFEFVESAIPTLAVFFQSTAPCHDMYEVGKSGLNVAKNLLYRCLIISKKSALPTFIRHLCTKIA